MRTLSSLLLCTLIASKGVDSGTGSSMTVGKDCEMKGVCIHAMEACEVGANKKGVFSKFEQRHQLFEVTRDVSVVFATEDEMLRMLKMRRICHLSTSFFKSPPNQWGNCTATLSLKMGKGVSLVGALELVLPPADAKMSRG